MTVYLTTLERQIIAYQFPAEMASTNIQFGYDGTGYYISYWNVVGTPQPTTNAEIDAWATDPIYLFNYNYAMRRTDPTNGYPEIYTLLEMLYQDLCNNTATWANKMGSVDCAYYPLNGVTTTPATVEPFALFTGDLSPASMYDIVIASGSGSQSISGTTKTTVDLTSEQTDANNCWASNTFTAPTAGVYEVSAFVQTANLAIVSLLNAYSWQLYVTQTGSSSASTLVGLYTHAILAATDSQLQGTKLISMAAGDALSLQVQKSVSTSLDVSNAYINIKKVSST
jgi:hypothetical protein